MKIFHLTDDIFDAGGAEQYIWDLCEELSCFNIINYAIHQKGRKEPQSWWKGYYPRLSAKILSVETAEAEKVLKKVHSVHPDLIFVHNYTDFTVLEECLRHYPVVCYGHDFRPLCLGYRYYAGKACRKVFGWGCASGLLRHCFDYHPLRIWKTLTIRKKTCDLFRRARLLFVASSFMQKEYHALGLETTVMPYFLRETAFHRPLVGVPDADGAARIPAVPRPALFVGRLTPIKGLRELLGRMVGMKPDLVVAGEGWERRHCERTSPAGRARFVGWKYGSELRALYRESSVLVIPSLWPEPFGRVGMEAMAQGTPVVAFDVGGIGSWMENGRGGQLIPPYDWPAFFSAVNTLAGDPARARALGEEGRTRVAERFNARDHVTRMREHLEKIVTKA